MFYFFLCTLHAHTCVCVCVCICLWDGEYACSCMCACLFCCNASWCVSPLQKVSISHIASFDLALASAASSACYDLFETDKLSVIIQLFYYFLIFSFPFNISLLNRDLYFTKSANLISQLLSFPYTYIYFVIDIILMALGLCYKII